MSSHPKCNKKDNTEFSGPLQLFNYLNKVGGQNGIGLLDMVENRYVGIKSRGVYETPGGTILHKAHMDIEGIAMDREVMRLRNMLSPIFSELVYNGFWFSPEMDFLRAAIDKSQELIDKVGGRFKLTALVQKRLSELMQGSRPLIKDVEDKTTLEIVIQEILQDKIALDDGVPSEPSEK